MARYLYDNVITLFPQDDNGNCDSDYLLAEVQRLREAHPEWENLHWSCTPEREYPPGISRVRITVEDPRSMPLSTFIFCFALILIVSYYFA